MSAQRSVVSSSVAILKALPQVGPRGQIASLAKLTSLPRPTIYRLLGQLSAAGVVEVRADGTYGLAVGVTTLSRSAEPVVGLRRQSLSVLADIRARTGAAVSLVVADGASAVALEMIPGHDHPPIDARSGALMPRDTAAGRGLWPSAVPRDRRRAGGAAVDEGDLLPGLSCYAAPLRLPGGGVAALQIATPSTRPAEGFAPVVLRACRALGDALNR